MNIDKNKSIYKGLIFSKTIFPAVGAWLLVTQTGCGGTYGHLGAGDQASNQQKKGSSSENPISYSKDGIKFNTEDILPYMEGATAVISNAQKLVIFIPKLANGGEPAVYPPEHEEAAERILDYQGNSIDYKGFVFFNPTDQCYQVAKGDGTGVMIINQPTEEQVVIVRDKTMELNPNSDLNTLSIEQLKELNKYMVEKGIKDFYSSDKAYVENQLKKVEDNSLHGNKYCGVYRRKTEVVCKAILISTPGEGLFYGTATANPQKFAGKAVIIQQGDDVRLVQPDIFTATYTYADGTKIELKDWQAIDATQVKK